MRIAVLTLLAASAILAGCGGQHALPLSPAGPSVAGDATRPATSPSEIMYLLIGGQKNQMPSVAAYDADSPSETPKPLYTIAPNGLGTYGNVRVDANDNLFVSKYLANETKIYMFPPGASKPSATCIISPGASALSISNGILYAALSGGSDTIQEYAEPFTGGSCAKPKKTLTDEIALREGGTELFDVTEDSAGNIFDIYEGGPGMAEMYMDEFTAGSDHAHPYYKLGESYDTFLVIADAHKNLITNYSQEGGTDPNDYLAVFPDEAKKLKLYYPLGDGAWSSLALAKDQTELFALGNTYRTLAVSVFSYASKTGTIGKQKRSYTIENLYDGAMAVYSK
jgi:hypothetical protein